MKFLIYLSVLIGLACGQSITDWFNCTTCAAEIATCDADASCLAFASAYNDAYNNATTGAEPSLAAAWGFKNAVCNTGFDGSGTPAIDCVATGFGAYFDCAVIQENCYPLGPGDCDTEFGACLDDNECTAILEYMPAFDTGDEWTAAVANVCWFGDGTYDTACDLYRDYFTCLVTSNGCTDGGQCQIDGCTVQTQSAHCIFDFNCGYPWYYFTGGNEAIGITSFEEICTSGRLCLEDTAQLDKDFFCTQVFIDAPWNGCTQDFEDLYAYLLSCAGNNTESDCVYDNCDTLIKTCNNDFWENFGNNDTENQALCGNPSFCAGNCATDLWFVANIEKNYGTKAAWLFDQIEQFYCNFWTRDGSCQTELDNAYTCYTDNCADFSQTQCYQEMCQNEIVTCFGDASCGGNLLAHYMAPKQECYNNIYEYSYGMMQNDPVNYPTYCRCKQDGDNSTYWAENAQYFDSDCYDRCRVCDDNAYNELIGACNGGLYGDCGNIGDVFGCIFEECGQDENPDDGCDVTGCGREIASCQFDIDCYTAFWGNYDHILKVLTEAGDILEDGFFSLSDYTRLTKTLAQYHCGVDVDGTTMVCSDLFWNLWQCFADECWFNDCIWQQCGDKLDTCLDNNALCYNNLEWISHAFEENVLWYAHVVSGADVDTSICDVEWWNGEEYPAQCYYYNVAGYCLTWGCNQEFWDVVDCLFGNCDEGGFFADIDYSLSGTTNVPCAIIQTALQVRSLTYENLCLQDWTLIAYCAFDVVGEDNTTDTNAIQNYWTDTLGTTCNVENEIDGTVFVFANCDDTSDVYADILTIYLNIRFTKRDAFEYALNNWNPAIITAVVEAVEALDATCEFEADLWGNLHTPVGDGVDGSCWKLRTKSPTQDPTSNPTEFLITDQPTPAPSDDVVGSSNANQIKLFIAFIAITLATLLN